jgi:DNA modification methylase
VSTWEILVGDCRSLLATLPAESVQACITSPPYYGLRDYGAEGQIGLEFSPEEYVAELVAVFREVRRVLRPDGTLWLNLGDSYSGHPPGNARPDHSGNERTGTRGTQGSAAAARGAGIPEGTKPKNLLGIPWRVALALQADGWYLRADIIWHKPNAMPESVTDRPTRAHEYLFLLSKAERYHYDADVIREPHAEPRDRGHGKSAFRGQAELRPRGNGQAAARSYNPLGRNRRSVWEIATVPFPGAHFATMPPRLVEPCVLAGSREGDLVLDPFAGAGTVGLVATRLRRSFVGVELNPAYAQIAKERILGDAPLLNAGGAR